MSTVIQFPERPSEPLPDLVTGEVKALMGRYGVSQMMLAAWMHMAQTAVSARLRGATRWTLADIERIAEGFNVHPAQLLGGYAPTPRPDGPDTMPILKLRARRDSNPQPSDLESGHHLIDLDAYRQDYIKQPDCIPAACLVAA